MSEKTLRAALYFLAGVTALYLVVTVVSGGGNGPAEADPDLTAALDDMDGASLTQIGITGPRDTIRLARDGGDWTVNGFEADSGAVARILRAVDEVKITSVAATNPANHGRLGVTADSAWTVTAEDGTTVLLGKVGPRFRTAYARLPDADLVSLVEGDLRAAAARTLFEWREKTILRADTAAVTSLRITRDGETALYERQDSSWTVDGAEADATKVRNVLQELAGLRASGFAPEDAVMPAEPDRTVQAMDASGNVVAAVSLAEQEGNFWAFSSGSAYVFEVPTFRADRIVPAAPDDS